jgi:hypothetical protein
MSGFTKAALIFSIATFVVSTAAAYLTVAWCGLPFAIVLGLAVGYVGAYWQKGDPAKTARIARSGAKAGLVAGVAGLVGGIVGGLLNPAADQMVVNLCFTLVTAGLLTIFAWLGGWSWARHEHERQTGYKPT